MKIGDYSIQHAFVFTLLSGFCFILQSLTTREGDSVGFGVLFELLSTVSETKHLLGLFANVSVCFELCKHRSSIVWVVFLFVFFFLKCGPTGNSQLQVFRLTTF